VFRWTLRCHEEGQAIRVVENKIMTICQCLTEQDVKRVIDFYKLANKEETNV